MKQLFTYQKSRGGIIDIEAEENKLLLITEANNEETPASDTGEVSIPEPKSWYYQEKAVK